MNTITRTALANLKQNRSKNILSGIAVVLTAMLIFVILSVGFGMLRLEKMAINAVYPNYHIMFRGVDEENVKKLKAYDDIEQIGLRTDIGESRTESMNAFFLAMDEKAIALQQLELESGTFPKQKQDVVVQQEIVDAFGIQAEIGDEIVLPYQLYTADGLGMEEQGSFQISGFMKSGEANEKENLYTVFCSMDFVQEKVPASEREYRVMFRLSEADSKTTDEIEARGKVIAADLDLPETNVVVNSEYLIYNYVDPSAYTIIAMIVLVVIFAGILSIYSIYYVSMTPKIQEYGKLRAMGATKRQIRQIVFREGMIATLISMPIGLIIGSLLPGTILRLMYGTIDNQNILAQAVKQSVEHGDIQLLQPWIYLVTIVVTVFTVVMSLVLPMRKAARISPVEAMRYQEHGEQKKRRDGKQERKGYEEMNLFRITKANLWRNKRRTIITIVTLSMTGILYVVISTVLSCANPKEIARASVELDYRIHIDSWSDDMMHPEKMWRNIQQNNPMDDAFLAQIQGIPGVEQVKTKLYIDGEMPEYADKADGGNLGIVGLDESYVKVLEEGILEGDVTYKELLKGDKIILRDIVTYFNKEIKVGDEISIQMECGDEIKTRTFEVAAFATYPNSIVGGNSAILPQSVVEEINPKNNLRYYCEVKVKENMKEKVYPMLQTLADDTEMMATDSYEDELSDWQTGMQLVNMMCYVFLGIISAIGIMNLVNTMINSIYARKRELGMMQAIALSEKQLIRMLQLEGMFYTCGMLILSVGIGSIVGYAAYTYAKNAHLFSVQSYHYPLIQVLLLTIIVLLIQLMLTYMISRNFRKLSLIDRIRYAE